MVSETTNRYVHVEQDDTFSIALLAFKEAVEKYNEDKGPFLNFVRIVIRSRVIDYLRSEKNHSQNTSLDSMAEEGVQFEDPTAFVENELALEIEAWKEIMVDFKIDLERLIDESPKHIDTRERAINISERSSKHPPITEPLYAKKRLPIKLTATYNKVSEKVIKGSKTFITSTIIVFKQEFSSLIEWIKGG